MSKACVVGFLADISMGDRMTQYRRIAEMAFAHARQAGVLDGEVAIVMREVEGLPKGSGDAVVAAYRQLVNEGAVAVIGPFVTDNCTYLKPTVDACRVPTIAWCGASSWLGEWTFSLPNGSLLDEGPLLALYALRKGWTRIAVLRDASEIGETYYRHFAQAAKRYGLEIVSEQAVAPLATDLRAEVALARAGAPDVLIYLGYGMAIQCVNAALDGWQVPKLCSTAFVFAYRPEYLAGFEGWSGLDQMDPANPYRQRFLDRCEADLGWRPPFMTATLMYDSASVLAEAIGMAPALTPVGVLAGLESVRLLPAASGGANTTISFGPYSRKGWEGSRYLVLNKVEGGRIMFESYLDP
ncbi:ABC transporter substrate-binding protein [Sphingomonas flavalba]|uniref:ABC transporter substrate-binding protein n=1 Tax=Sphingomonas flavalba TaxID=2559804 RepID=UPI0039E10E31